MCEHKWIVYSTAINQKVLLVKCEKCSMRGSISNPTDYEWKMAFFAPSYPFVYVDNEERIVKDEKISETN